VFQEENLNIVIFLLFLKIIEFFMNSNVALAVFSSPKQKMFPKV